MSHETILTKDRATVAPAFTRSDGDQPREAAIPVPPAPGPLTRFRRIFAAIFHHEGDTFDGGS